MRLTSVFAFGLSAVFFSITSSAHAQTTSELHGGASGLSDGAISNSPFSLSGRASSGRASSRRAPYRAYRYSVHRSAARSRGLNTASRGCLTGDTQRVLSGLEARFGAVKVISTCRPGARIAGNGRPSQPGFGRAVDFVPRPGQRAAALAWLRANANGAVITYASGHIHFDTGGYRVYASSGARRAYARMR